MTSAFCFCPPPPACRRASFTRPLLVLLLALAPAACAGADASADASADADASGAPAAAAFDGGGVASLEALGRGVVAALAAGDTAALAAHRVTERDHNELLYPSFPAAREDPPFPAALAWENIQTRNAAALYGWLPAFRRDRPAFAGVECAGVPDRYPTFTIHQDCAVTLRRADGTTGKATLFRSAVEMGGRFKVIRYHRD